jgi:hypothetical protein
MKTLESVLVRRNFIRTSNPFNLADPPPWFLDSLAALDAELVVFASTHHPCYRMCRRVTKTKDLSRPIASWPDTYILVAHRLAPWKSILPTSLDMSWARVLQEIPEYDQWAFKDGDAVADHLDGREAAAEANVRRDTANGADQLSAYTYRVAQRMLGSRVGLSDRPHRTV